MDKPNGPQPAMPPLTVQQLYAMIGQLTVENQMLRAQLESDRQQTSAKVPAKVSAEKPA